MAIVIGAHTEIIVPGGGDSYFVTLPSSSENDIIVCAAASDQGPMTSPRFDLSWTSIASLGGSSLYTEIIYKRMGATPDTYVDYDPPSTQETLVACVALSGVDTTTALDAALNFNGPLSSGMPSSPAHTTVTNGAMRIITGHLDDDEVVMAPPAGFGNTIAFHTSSQGSSSTPGCAIGVAFLEATTAGSNSGGTWTAAGGDDTNWASHFSLRPADGAPAPGPRRTGKIYNYG